ncbi:type I-B CRISPR-associated protein Cas7/Cst2/DevR [Synechococcus sp. PCC 7336]|uniref:type I-B CRISPR-associated protein Cas7/Cst2/DevR n=1 Tax=Synechococcus sp. PCC 7336 TaxID=195250 RepID=UPI00034886FF|nr:type I-B CRISPR-associated protein Cas7/Cst2/DevR [Synechococcus sp. PCC 7336]
MSTHLFATIVTPTAVAANNRGEGDGSTLATLQTITRGNDQYTTVSAEAIRWAMREYFQHHYPGEINRTFDPDTDKYEFKDERCSAEKFIDDDLFGYMDAKKDKNNKNATVKRRGALEVCRAMSLDPYWGDVAFGSKGGAKDNKSIHSTQMHCTAYQYTIALTPEHLKQSARAGALLEALVGIRHVGGNHSRFLYEFRPESIVLRVTDDPSPWIMGCFKRIGEEVGCTELERVIQAGDVDAGEVVVGGKVAKTPYGQKLRNLNVKVFDGVKAAKDAAKARLTKVGVLA